MADDGYLIGFEDTNGNFVEVGRFNNLSGNTSDPVFIEHTGSGTRMELDGSGFDMNGNDITNAGSVSTQTIGGDRHLAEAYNGSDPDARLDSALSAAVDGDTILMENAIHDANHTISTDVTLIGSGQNQEGTTISNGTWTFDDTVTLNQIGRIESGPSLIFNSPRSYIANSYLFLNAPTITVSSNQFRFINNRGGEVDFGSTANAGIVDGCTKTTVIGNTTDNTVGDIA